MLLGNDHFGSGMARRADRCALSKRIARKCQKKGSGIGFASAGPCLATTYNRRIGEVMMYPFRGEVPRRLNAANAHPKRRSRRYADMAANAIRARSRVQVHPTQGPPVRDDFTGQH